MPQSLSVRRWIYPIPAACVASFMAGLPIALAVFGSAIRDRDPSLYAPFVAGGGVRSLSDSAAVVLGGIIIDYYPNKIKLFGILGACLNLSVAFLALGSQWIWPRLIFWGNLWLGFGTGMIYILGVLLIAQWIPDNMGLAMALSMVTNSAGTILGTKLFDYLINTTGVTNALYIATVIFFVPRFLASLFFEVPPPNWSPDTDQVTPQQAQIITTDTTYFESPQKTTTAISPSTIPPHPQNIQDELKIPRRKIILKQGHKQQQQDHHQHDEISITTEVIHPGKKLGTRLFKQKELYLFLLIIGFGTGPCYAIAVSFPSILKDMMNINNANAASLLGVMNLVGLFTRFLAGFVAESVGFGTGFFYSGSKNMTIVVMLTQIMACYCVPIAASLHQSSAFVVFLALCFLVFASIPVFAVILCRQMFSQENSGLVFGISSGFSGFFTMIFSFLAAQVGAQASKAPLLARIQVYEHFFHMCAYTSVVGLVSAILINKCKAAFSKRSVKKVITEESIAEDHIDPLLISEYMYTPAMRIHTEDFEIDWDDYVSSLPDSGTPLLMDEHVNAIIEGHGMGSSTPRSLSRVSSGSSSGSLRDLASLKKVKSLRSPVGNLPILYEPYHDALLSRSLTQRDIYHQQNSLFLSTATPPTTTHGMELDAAAAAAAVAAGSLGAVVGMNVGGNAAAVVVVDNNNNMSVINGGGSGSLGSVKRVSSFTNINMKRNTPRVIMAPKPLSRKPSSTSVDNLKGAPLHRSRSGFMKLDTPNKMHMEEENSPNDLDSKASPPINTNHNETQYGSIPSSVVDKYQTSPISGSNFDARK